MQRHAEQLGAAAPFCGTLLRWWCLLLRQRDIDRVPFLKQGSLLGLVNLRFPNRQAW